MCVNSINWLAHDWLIYPFIYRHHWPFTHSFNHLAPALFIHQIMHASWKMKLSISFNCSIKFRFVLPSISSFTYLINHIVMFGNECLSCFKILHCLLNIDSMLSFCGWWILWIFFHKTKTFYFRHLTSLKRQHCRQTSQRKENINNEYVQRFFKLLLGNVGILKKLKKIYIQLVAKTK